MADNVVLLLGLCLKGVQGLTDVVSLSMISLVESLDAERSVSEARKGLLGCGDGTDSLCAASPLRNGCQLETSRRSKSERLDGPGRSEQNELGSLVKLVLLEESVFGAGEFEDPLVLPLSQRSKR